MEKRFPYTKHVTTFVIVVAITIILISNCSPRVFEFSDHEPLTVDTASWNETNQSVAISGTSNTDGPITIDDGIDGNRLAIATASGGVWNTRIDGYTCRVVVAKDDQRITTEIMNAPTSCATIGEDGVRSRELASPSIRVAAEKNNPLATWPEGAILSPSRDVTIQQGETVRFAATAQNLGDQRQLNFNWDFDGSQPNSSVQNPGTLRFDAPGVFNVRLHVSNNLGVADPTPSTRVIRVLNRDGTSGAPNNGTVNTPFNQVPVPHIIAPASQSINVNVGERVRFRGDASAPGFDPNSFRYFWDFGGAPTNPSPNLNSREAGDIEFTRAGTYVIRLNARTNTDIPSAYPAYIIVNVIANISSGVGTTPNLPPTGFIQWPTGNIVVNVGDTLNFSGDGFDPDDVGPLNFEWNFGGAIPAVIGRVASGVRFTTAGIYMVRLIVRDARGLANSNPPFRIITCIAPPTGGGNTGFSLTQNLILSPPQDVIIDAGQSVNFIGQAAIGLPEAAQVPLQYFWNFDGAAPVSQLQSPGPITFSQPGIYQISFLVGNSVGQLVDGTATRSVTVRGQSTLPPQSVLASPIISPRGSNITINIGGSVLFSANQIMPPIGQQIRYVWHFSGNASPDIPNANAGNIRFLQAGIFYVTLHVQLIDSLGNLLSQSRFPVIVNVVANSLASLSGFSGIRQPSVDWFMLAGNSILFEGDDLDPIRFSNVNYLWEFNALNSYYRLPNVGNPSARNLGSVRFEDAGEFEVRYTVTGVDRSNNRLTTLTSNRRIVVIPPSVGGFGFGLNQPQTAGTLRARIQGADDGVRVRVGEGVNFFGGVDGASPNAQLFFEWDFDGATSNSFAQNPGRVTFNRVGDFAVTLRVRDETGNSDPNPPRIRVRVEP